MENHHDQELRRSANIALFICRQSPSMSSLSMPSVSIPSNFNSDQCRRILDLPNGIEIVSIELVSTR